MTISGYIDTIGLVGPASVRYCGVDENGAGIAAFDVTDWGDALQLTEYGKIYLLQPHPDDPDSWPDWARGPGHPSVPKRHVAIGDERFVLLRPTKHSANELHSAVAPQARASAVVSSDGESCVLVELGASDPFIADAEVVFDRRITEFIDSRIPAGVAG